jgi:UDP-GlcNAc:undecaprenyl-phosphate/decaprenyl-phosphate GlcNAc-1-phosphate transferase
MYRPFSYIVWFAGSAALAFGLTPLARSLAHRIGLVDRPGGQSYKWHQRPTAYLGGAAIALAVVVMALLPRTRPPADQVTVILLGGLVCGAVGLWDDWRSLRVGPKLGATFAGGIAVWTVGVRVALTGSLAIDFVLTVAWVVVVTHAVNVIDNMDGVAVGLVAVSATAVFTIAILGGETRVALMAAVIAGACVGFLPFNVGPATVFLGDAGTLFLGFVLASLALALDLPGRGSLVRASVPVILLGVPIFNAALVVVSRRRSGRPIVVGATDGVAHRLVARGLTRTQAAVAFWLSGAALAGVSFAVSRASESVALAIDAGLLAIAIAALWAFERADPLSRTDASTATAVSIPWVPASAGALPHETQGTGATR